MTETPLLNVRLVLLLCLAAGARADWLPHVHIGYNPKTEKTKKISIFPDIASADTYISARDFECTEEYSCILLPQVYTDKIDGRDISYQKALVVLNLTEDHFEEKVEVNYISDQSYTGVSRLGLRDHSPFLEYYFEQNQHEDESANFRVNTDYEIELKDRPAGGHWKRLDYEMAANVDFVNATGLGLPATVRFCITNRLDFNSTQVVFGVREAEYQRWSEAIRSYLERSHRDGQRSPGEIIFTLVDDSNIRMAQLDVSLEKLVDDQKLLIAPFAPDFDDRRGCDVYTGTLLLRTFDFCYYYSEYEHSYKVEFGFRELGPVEEYEVERDPEAKTHFMGLKLVLFLLVMMLIGYLIYKYMNRDDRPIEVYRSQEEVPDPVELRPTEKSQNQPS